MKTTQLPAALVAMSLAAVALPALAGQNPAPRATAAHRTIVAEAPLPRERARDLYSVHARRMVRAYLQLRLLELRELELDRVRAVVEGRLGVDELFDEEAMQPTNRGNGR